MKKYKILKESTVIEGKALDVIQVLGLEKTPLLERKTGIYNDSKLYDEQRIQNKHIVVLNEGYKAN